MRKVVSNREVPHLWAHQTQDEAKNSNGSLYFHGKTIYSYGSHFPIATFVENSEGQTALLFTTRSHSVTTTGHCSAVRSSVRHISPVFDIPLTPDLYRFCDQSQFIASNKGIILTSYLERIEELSGRVARSKVNREWLYSSLVSLVSQANAFCEFFGLATTVERNDHGTVTQVPLFAVPESFEALRSQLAQVAAQKAAKERQRKKQVARENADKVARWIAGENLNLPYSLDTVYLRIEGNEVVTSRGARFPVEHAAKGLAFVRSLKQAGKEYRRNGHTFHLGHYAIDRIDANGNVTAGCHFVKYPEVERLAPQLEALTQAHGSN